MRTAKNCLGTPLNTYSLFIHSLTHYQPQAPVFSACLITSAEKGHLMAVCKVVAIFCFLKLGEWPGEITTCKRAYFQPIGIHSSGNCVKLLIVSIVYVQFLV